MNMVLLLLYASIAYVLGKKEVFECNWVLILRFLDRFYFCILLR